MKKLSKNNIITIALIIAIYAIVFVLEKVIDSNSMLFIVLKKGRHIRPGGGFHEPA